MYKTFDERLCSGCTHLVLKGVACDWRPGECPYLQAEKRENRPSTGKAVYISMLAANDEFDAVKSVN